MRRAIFVIVMLAGCGSPVEKEPNGTANNAATNNSTAGTNNSTTGTNSGTNSTTANIQNIIPGECQNNTTYPSCDEFYAEVPECEDGQVCVTEESCGFEILCARIVTPATWHEACENDFDCEPAQAACQVDEDCVLVPSGDPCGCTECLVDAIETANEAAYVSNFTAGRNACASLAPCPDIACIETVSHCDLQTFQCAAREAKYVTTTGLPDECQEASDCVAVFEGEICDACQCPNEAIPASEESTYRQQFDVDCASGVACDCVPYEIACVENRCELLTE